MSCENIKTQPIEESDFCPEDGVTQHSCCSHFSERKKPFYKKWWVWTIASVALVFSIGAVFSYRRDKQFYKKILDLITQQ